MNKQKLPKKSSYSVFRIFVALLLILSVLTGCTTDNKDNSPLDPENPISITLWHYYSGHTKTKFDQLVAQFNDTVGLEKGIVVDAQSQGDIEQLAAAVFNAANHKIGSEPLPDIFAAYPDNAYRINQIAELVNIEKYFSDEELQSYRQEFLNEGQFGEENKLKIVPVAKSTENLYINKTTWDQFSKATGAKTEQLSTWEGILKTAEKYYEWSGGKAFLGIDSLANYMLISSMQLGEEMFSYNENNIKLNFKKEVARKLWDSYYVPHMKGYFAKNGRFSSDDAKVGTIIAYTGSTAGAVYFPTEVTFNESKVQPIESLVLPYPYFKDGKRYAVQQGAGMVIVESDEAHEYAAAQFLKWFTDPKQNIDFAVSTAYFPVKNEALNKDTILSAVEKNNTNTPEILTSSIKTTIQMFDEYTMYGHKPFEGSFDMRQMLNTNLLENVQKDLDSLSNSQLTNEERANQLATFLSDEHFEKWYAAFLNEAKQHFQ